MSTYKKMYHKLCQDIYKIIYDLQNVLERNQALAYYLVDEEKETDLKINTSNVSELFSKDKKD